MQGAVDPVNIRPIPPLSDSYISHSTLPDDVEQHNEGGWIMGIDEAGRGPVLGPMVYACAFCPISFKPTLEGIGFDDSKALSAETRQALWESFDENVPLCYSSSTISPQAISAGMLRRIPINLNRQAEDATISLIRGALNRGIKVKEGSFHAIARAGPELTDQCYVDALGPSPQWQARLSQIFPTVTFTVCPKADSLFKIVGAASIIAKVTRDRYIENWSDPEDRDGQLENDSEEDQTGRGSGYPSDPRTVAYLKDNIDPVFGYKGIVRFSWATVKVLLDKQAVECRWNDDSSQPSALSYFGAESDVGRPKIWKDLGVSGVGDL